MLFENKNAPPLNKSETMIKGDITFCNDSPDDLSATNSKCSPKLPKVMSDESNKARGNANGKVFRAT